MRDRLTIALCAPADFDRATLVGRLWLPDVGGPALVAVRSDGVYDLSRIARDREPAPGARRPGASDSRRR